VKIRRLGCVISLSSVPSSLVTVTWTDFQTPSTELASEVAAGWHAGSETAAIAKTETLLGLRLVPPGGGEQHLGGIALGNPNRRRDSGAI